MNDERLARRYAQAFFYASHKKNILDLMEKDFLVILNVWKQIENLKKMIIHDDISTGLKEVILKKIFEQKIETLTFSALRLLLSKHREYLLEAIIHEFITLCQKQKGFLEIHIYSTILLDEPSRKQIIDKFEKATQKKIIPLFYINPNLIAGIKILYNNLQIDGSVQGGLHRLREQLAHDITNQELLN